MGLPPTDWKRIGRTFKEAVAAQWASLRLWCQLLLLLAKPVGNALRIVVDAALPHLREACVLLWRWWRRSRVAASVVARWHWSALRCLSG